MYYHGRVDKQEGVRKFELKVLLSGAGLSVLGAIGVVSLLWLAFWYAAVILGILAGAVLIFTLCFAESKSDSYHTWTDSLYEIYAEWKWGSKRQEDSEE